MSANQRLLKMQSALKERGLRDVKFCFSATKLAELPSSQVANSVADFLEAYYNGRYKVVEKIHDAPVTA